MPAKTASGRIKFDGYDSQRKVLIDAKDWGKWPPVGEKWAEKTVIKKLVGQARDQAAVGKQTGHSVEWHVPTQGKAAQVAELLKKEGIKGIKLVVTPK